LNLRSTRVVAFAGIVAFADLLQELISNSVRAENTCVRSDAALLRFLLQAVILSVPKNSYFVMFDAVAPLARAAEAHVALVS
jgi:hypothetical protein